MTTCPTTFIDSSREFPQPQSFFISSYSTNGKSLIMGEPTSNGVKPAGAAIRRENGAGVAGGGGGGAQGGRRRVMKKVNEQHPPEPPPP